MLHPEITHLVDTVDAYTIRHPSKYFSIILHWYFDHTYQLLHRD